MPPASQFDDLDALEGGFAREMLRPAATKPSSARSDGAWTRGRLYAKKSCFWLFDDDGNFLLSARREGSDFFVSQYEDFFLANSLAASAREPTLLSHLCVLRLNAFGNGYQLFSRTCEHCDRTLGKFSCGGASDPDAPGVGGGGGDRQHLADVLHCMRVVPGAGVDAKQLRVSLPAMNDGFQDVWCPRRAAELGQDSSNSKEQEPLSLESRLPMWDPASGQLQLGFDHDRPIRASNRNFLLADRDQTPLFFIGKAKTGQYYVDWRFPLSQIQALAIALSTFAWR